jgi:hypothetical protein
LALVGGEWPTSCPDCFTPGEKALSTHWIGGWLGPRTGLEGTEKIKFSTLLGFKLQPVDGIIFSWISGRLQSEYLRPSLSLSLSFGEVNVI